MPAISAFLFGAVCLPSCWASPATPPANGPLRQLQAHGLVDHEQSTGKERSSGGLTVQRSGWTDGPEPPNKCHQTLLLQRKTCCWMEKEHRTYQEVHGGSKLHTRWACTPMDDNHDTCDDLAHRFSYPAEPQNVHQCTRDVHRYKIYTIEMAISLVGSDGGTEKLKEGELPDVDTAVEHGITELLNVTHRSVVIAKGATVQTIDWPHGTYEDGCVIVVHFQRDMEMEALRDEALSSGDNALVAERSVVVANVALAMGADNVFKGKHEDLGASVLRHLQQSSGDIRNAQSVWLNITVDDGEHVNTMLVDGAPWTARVGCWGLFLALASLYAATATGH